MSPEGRDQIVSVRYVDFALQPSLDNESALQAVPVDGGFVARLAAGLFAQGQVAIGTSVKMK